MQRDWRAHLCFSNCTLCKSIPRQDCHSVSIYCAPGAVLGGTCTKSHSLPRKVYSTVNLALQIGNRDTEMKLFIQRHRRGKGEPSIILTMQPQGPWFLADLLTSYLDANQNVNPNSTKQEYGLGSIFL